MLSHLSVPFLLDFPRKAYLSRSVAHAIERDRIDHSLGGKFVPISLDDSDTNNSNTDADNDDALAPLVESPTSRFSGPQNTDQDMENTPYSFSLSAKTVLQSHKFERTFLSVKMSHI